MGMLRMRLTILTNLRSTWNSYLSRLLRCLYRKCVYQVFRHARRVPQTHRMPTLDFVGDIFAYEISMRAAMTGLLPRPPVRDMLLCRMVVGCIMAVLAAPMHSYASKQRHGFS